MVDVGDKARDRAPGRGARGRRDVGRDDRAGPRAATSRRATSIATARIAGIQAAKRTAELIPLCHPLPLSFVDVSVELGDGEVALTAEARTAAQTGVEMEAMTACAVAALTVYDMVKGVERGVRVGARRAGGEERWQV